MTGKDQFENIECIAISYFINRGYYQNATTNEINNKLIEAGEHAKILSDLLSDGKVFAHLQNKTQSFYSEKEAAKLANNPYSTFASAVILSDLHTIIFVSTILKEQQKKTGRRRGTGKIAEKRLVENLYLKICQISGKPPTNTQNGMFQQLIKILNKPLGLGGTLPGIVRQVIDENKPKKQAVQANVSK